MTVADEDDGRRAEEMWTRQAEQAEQRAALYEQLAEQTDALSVTETVGPATVTVDAAGVVTKLDLTDDLDGRKGRQVASDILTAMHRAQAQLSDQMAALAAATVGPDDKVGANMTQRLRDRFGEPTAQTPTTTQPRERPPIGDDDDFGDESLMLRPT